MLNVSGVNTASKWGAALNWMPARLVALFVALAALDLACQVLGGLMVHRMPVPLRDVARLSAALFLSVAMIVAYRRLIQALEKRRPDELGTAAVRRGLSSGVAIGISLFVLVYGILWVLGAVTFQGLGGSSGIAAAIAVAMASAVGEEIVFRGVVFRLLEDRLGTGAALILSATAFGLIHAGNHGATWVSTLSIALESGVLLGLAYAASRTLWLPIGLHFGWNFAEGGIFGAAVSGGQYAGLIAAPLSGPSLLTGGAFGPEASIVALVVSLGVSGLLAWWVVHAYAWRPWHWRTVDG